MSDNREAWKKHFQLVHKPGSGSGCHVCRNAVAPAKPRQPFACKLNLQMPCDSFADARKPAFTLPGLEAR